MATMACTLFVRLVLCISILLVSPLKRCVVDTVCFYRIPKRSIGKVDIMGTRGAWANDFLRALGNANPDDNTIKLVAAWTRVENTRARFNPLATTLTTDTSTKFNYANVKNYPTRQDGINASVRTLNGNHAGYERLRNALLTNDVTAAFSSGGFDTWGSHTAKVMVTYNSGDYRHEPLKSDESGAVSGGTWDDPTPALETSERAKPENERVQRAEINEEDIRYYLKSALGVIFIAAGALVFVVGIIKTDTVQSTLTTAAKLTPIGGLVP